MADVELIELQRHYGDVKVVDGVSAHVKAGEFVSFLGPSGCGKTTTLRMVAGLDEPVGGEIRIGGELVSAPARGVHIPPERRRIGMVFQTYALWPHMTVAENVAYPLRLAGVSPGDISVRVQKCLDMVHLGTLSDRAPDELSGGQQQRVALARALVVEPTVLLLDEPLSNLDATLREEMRFEIKDLQVRLGITVVLVTHDQGEAFAMSDRIMVMNKGRIAQMGSPAEIYRCPADLFVAGFVGIANLAHGTVGDSNQVLLDGSVRSAATSSPCGLAPGTRVQVAIRPESVSIAPEATAGLKAVVERVTFLGDREDLQVRCVDRSWRIQRDVAVTGTPETVPCSPGKTVTLHVREVAVVGVA